MNSKRELKVIICSQIQFMILFSFLTLCDEMYSIIWKHCDGFYFNKTTNSIKILDIPCASKEANTVHSVQVNVLK